MKLNKKIHQSSPYRIRKYMSGYLSLILKGKREKCRINYLNIIELKKKINYKFLCRFFNSIEWKLATCYVEKVYKNISPDKEKELIFDTMWKIHRWCDKHSTTPIKWMKENAPPKFELLQGKELEEFIILKNGSQLNQF